MRYPLFFLDQGPLVCTPLNDALHPIRDASDFYLHVWTPHDQTLSVPPGEMFLPSGELLPGSF